MVNLKGKGREEEDIGRGKDVFLTEKNEFS